MLFLLDLDETLLFSEGEEADGLWFLPRPYLSEFLEFLNLNFTVAIYTVGSYDYAKEAVNKLFPFEVSKKYIFHKKYVEKVFNPEMFLRTSYKKIHKISDKLGFERSNVVILDDLKSARVTPLSKVIKAPNFTGNLDDCFLLDLKNKIQTVLNLGYLDNVDFVKQLNYIAENKPEYHKSEINE